MKRKIILLLCLVQTLSNSFANKKDTTLKFYSADNAFIQYVGRIDFSNKQLPRFWQPGVYVSAKFKGSECDVILNDEELWGKNHNYLEIIVDGNAYRTQTKSKTDTIHVKNILGSGIHHLIVCKNTEANIGYLELVGIRCKKLLKPEPLPERKMEFIGNSITCGASSDMSEIPCGTGVWQDQHNAWLSYGPVTARTLHAQYFLSSVSGIGLMHSCCNMKIIMPQVYDKISMYNNQLAWNFKNYQPDILSICLGQNDGVQDSITFCNNYISFIKTLRDYYPHAKFILLSSPMADAHLRKFLRATITSVVNTLHQQGETNLYKYIFEKQYHNGCAGHPDIKEHAQIASELVAFIKSIQDW